MAQDLIYQVRINGLPELFVTGPSAAQVKVDMRKLVRKPEDVLSVERVYIPDVRKKFRDALNFKIDLISRLQPIVTETHILTPEEVDTMINEEMTLWKYNPRSGLWSSERKVTDATKDEWMKIFKKDEPNASFVVSKKKPSGKPMSEEMASTSITAAGPAIDLEKDKPLKFVKRKKMKDFKEESEQMDELAFPGAYKAAAQVLQSVLDRKKKENSKLKHSVEYYASQVAKQYPGVDTRKLASMVEAKKMKGEDPCWDGYEMIGTKKKNGKEVPNCVKKEERTMKNFSDFNQFNIEEATAALDTLKAIAGVEIEEALTPKQKKIDKNKNGKIDGEDLAALRKESTDKPPFDGPYKKKPAVRKDKFGNIIKDKNAAKNLAKQGMAGVKKESVEQVDEISNEKLMAYSKKASADAREKAKTANATGDKKLASKSVDRSSKSVDAVRRVMNRNKGRGYHESVEQVDEGMPKNWAKGQAARERAYYKNKAKIDKAHAAMKAAEKKTTKEEVEQVDELSRQTLMRYGRKTRQNIEMGGKESEKRKQSRLLAGKKVWGGAGGIEKAKVMAKEEVEQVEEVASAFTRKELEAGNITIVKDKNGYRYLKNKSKNGAMGPYHNDQQVKTAILQIQKEEVEQVADVIPVTDQGLSEADNKIQRLARKYVPGYGKAVAKHRMKKNINHAIGGGEIPDDPSKRSEDDRIRVRHGNAANRYRKIADKIEEEVEQVDEKRSPEELEKRAMKRIWKDPHDEKSNKVADRQMKLAAKLRTKRDYPTAYKKSKPNLPESVEQVDEVAYMPNVPPKPGSMTRKEILSHLRKNPKDKDMAHKAWRAGATSKEIQSAIRNEEVEQIEEKSVSKAQQRMMGMALAAKRGEMDDASPEVKKMAKSMSTKTLKDFAKTKHKGLPEKVTKESVNNYIDEATARTVQCKMCGSNKYSKMENSEFGNTWTCEGCGTVSTRQTRQRKVTDMMKEAKSDYKIYHTQFSDAMREVERFAKAQGYEVDEDDYFRKVASGPRKPGKGKTNSYSIALMKGGKETKKMIQVQVYGMDSGKYELNTYIG